MEVSKFYYLVDRTFVAATGLFAISQTNRRGTALFRSHTHAALDDVGLIFRFDCRADLWNAPRAAGSAQTRCAISRSWARRDRAIISAPLSPRTLFPARVRFFPGSQ